MELSEKSIELSILLPVKDGENYISGAVRTTLSALPKNSELLVIDDSSNDKTLAVLGRFSDPRLRVIANPMQPGLVGSLNFGLGQCRGNVVGRMDSDDICFPWRFSLQLRALHRFPDLDFVFSTAVAFGKPLAPYFLIPQLPLRLSDSAFKDALSKRNPAVHPTMLAKRSVLESLGGYRQRPAEDLDLWLRAAMEGYRFRRLATPTICLRTHENQVTRSVEWITQMANDEELQLLRRQLIESLAGTELQVGKMDRYLGKLESRGLPKLIAPWKW